MFENYSPAKEHSIVYHINCYPILTIVTQHYPNTVYMSNTMETICGAGIAYSYSSEAPEITPIFRGVRFGRSLVCLCSVL